MESDHVTFVTHEKSVSLLTGCSSIQFVVILISGHLLHTAKIDDMCLSVGETGLSGGNMML